MTGMMRVPRSRGALTGVLLILLGAWGGLIPFIGPDFRYAYTPDTAWSWTSGRLWLEVLPGAAVLLGGLIVLGSKTRPVALLGAWLAALGGGWFAVGSVLSVLWMKANAAGTPVGGTVARVAEQIGFFTGLGVVIVFLAALALGRFTVIGVRDARLADRERAVSTAPDAGTEPVTSTVPVTSTEPATSTGPAASMTRRPEPAAVTEPDEAEAADEADAADDADAPDKVAVTS
jgi:hypothetical protein